MVENEPKDIQQRVEDVLVEYGSFFLDSFEGRRRQKLADEVSSAKEAILELIQEARASGRLEAFKYIAATPQSSVTILDLDVEPSHEYEQPIYTPPKEYVDDEITRLQGGDKQ